MRRLSFLLLFAWAGGSLFPAFKPWYNYYNPTYGAKAMALGNAFTSGPTAGFYNQYKIAAPFLAGGQTTI